MQSDMDTHTEDKLSELGICTGESWRWNIVMNDNKELIFHGGYKMSVRKDTLEL